MTKETILASANDEQQEAIKHQEGACMIIAGPGSGKTKTIVSRTQYMILNGIDPSSICLFTFTNKAANEMKERIRLAVGELADRITCGTYHSIANRLLRKYAQYIGYNRNFTIMTPDDCKKIFKKISSDYNLDPDQLALYISAKKDKVILPQQALTSAINDNDRILARAYEKYQEELKRQMAMDFDDLIINTILLLENNNDIKKKVNKKWKYISCDEGHDSSIMDLRFIRLLVGDAENVCFILDDNQSIYGFRGANIEAVMNIRNIYHDMKVYNLSRNYRCSQTIVEASKSLISRNKPLIEKKIRAARDYKGSPIIVSRVKSPKEEAARVVQYVQMLKKKGLNYRDIAILYRMSSSSRIIEQAFNTVKIKCKIVGGTPFFNRAEIQDILSYFKLLVNEYDFTAFKRAITVPKRGIGEKTIEKIDEFIREYPGGPISVRTALDKIQECNISKTNINKLKEFNNLLNELETDMTILNLKELINKLLIRIDIVKYLKDHPDYKKNWEERIGNVNELLNIASEYIDIQELLTQASLYTSDDEDPNDIKNDAVNLLTMHCSKGTEYKAVIIIDCNDGTSPHYKAIGSEKQLEEERRLFYVAMTRAKDYLFMLFPDYIMLQGELRYAKPSRFINEIDSEYIYRN